MNFLQVREELNNTVDVVALLEHYGAHNISIYPHEIRSQCILHDGQNSTSFRYNLKTRRWACFSNNCGGQCKKDLYNFVKLAEKRVNNKIVRQKEIINILMNFSNLNVKLDDIDFSYDKKLNDKLKNKGWARQVNMAFNKKINQIEESILKKYAQNTPLYFYQRGYSGALAQIFEIGFSPLGLNESSKVLELDFPGRIIIPIRSVDGKLVGLSGRLATDDKRLIEKYDKYRHTYNFDRRHILYNLHRAKNYIQESRKVILVEGFFDVIHLWQMDIKNVVATLGTNVNREQMLLLLPYCSEVYLMFDGDNAGREALKSTYKLACKYFNTFYVELPEGKDPSDLNLADYYKAMAFATK